MEKKVLYQYNPETDNYERVYPSLRDYLYSFLRVTVVALILACIIFLIVFYGFSSPDEKTLREENSQLKAQFNLLNTRIENAMDVMRDIQNRDDNFYRVMMQMDPVNPSRRLAGLSNEQRYKNLQKLSDAELVTQLTRNIDLLDRQIYVQSLSFNELASTASRQKDEIARIPAILPIPMSEYTMASGYGYRPDPIYGHTKFHEGIDFAASTGTPVYATAEGKVVSAGWRGSYGNCVDIDHANNYLTRFAHLSQIFVKEGQQVVRGEKIGLVGSTGKSTGPHLHYEVRMKDVAQNPVNYYFLDLTPEEYDEMIQQAENSGHTMD